MSRTHWIILILILVFSTLVRFYQLDQIPGGLNIDEASQGYNAYSLSLTGMDRYGQSLPILFRSFGSFQAPIYTYLSILPISILGPSIFPVRIIAALSGVIVVVATFLILMKLEFAKRYQLALLGTLVVAFVPWSIFFSRFATEAILGLALFVVSIYFFILSLSRPPHLVVAALILGLSTHAYYSERLISFLFLGGFIWLFKKILLKNKRWLVIAILIFIITQIPHLLVLESGAFTRRLNQVSYLDQQSFDEQSGNLKNLPLGKGLFISREFLSQYSAYYSFRNLFFDPDPQGSRSMPDLSVFYPWMVIPLLFGWAFILRNELKLFSPKVENELKLFSPKVENKSSLVLKILILLAVVSPIPAALTNDPFYSLRALVFLWTLAIIISFGIYLIFSNLRAYWLRFSLGLILILYSGLVFYITYFSYFKYERAEAYGYSYVKLMEKTSQQRSNNFVIDSTRDLSVGIRHAFLSSYDPSKIQAQLKLKNPDQYYSNVEFDEPYIIDNVAIRPIFWEEDIYQNLILVGDNLAISEDQIKEHKLKLEFEIKSINGETKLKAYSTNPRLKCLSEIKPNVRCQKWI